LTKASTSHPNPSPVSFPLIPELTLDPKFREAGYNVTMCMSDIYRPGMLKLAKDCAKEVGYDLKQGSSAIYHLPNFESPTDIQILKELGVTSVGASSIPEHSAVVALGMKNIHFSLITNMGCGLAV